MDSPDVVYYKDDFHVFIRMKDIFGEIEDSTDFDVRFFTNRSTSVYTASCKQGVCKNCIREDDGFRFIFDSHMLSTGTLRYETHFFIPDTIFPDGIRDVYKKGTLNIQLTKDDVGCQDPLQAEMLLPFIKGKDGKALTYDDLTDEDKRDLVGHIDPELIDSVSGEEFTDEEIERIAQAVVDAEKEQGNIDNGNEPELPNDVAGPGCNHSV